nr:calcium-activated chloride channel regulator 1-like [Chrysemys picta bellii]
MEKLCPGMREGTQNFRKINYFSEKLGLDIIKHDGVYSRYIYSCSENGRYNLKVHVQRANKTVRPHPTVPWSHSMYILGYIENVPVVRGSMVQLKNGGYEDIVIAINPELPEDHNIIRNIKVRTLVYVLSFYDIQTSCKAKLLIASTVQFVIHKSILFFPYQDMVKEASTYLFNATKQRFFFKAVKIIIPQHWLPKSEYLSVKTESYDKADVIVANPYLKYGDDPYTLQYGGCGEKGRYIHFTPDFLLNDTLYNIYGSRAKVFVHEWAHLRWGVFDEYNNDAPFYVSVNSGKASVEATRCSADITGKYIVQSCTGNNCMTRECDYDQQTKLYEAGCKFVPEKTQNAPASIMYMQSLPSELSVHNSKKTQEQKKFASWTDNLYVNFQTSTNKKGPGFIIETVFKDANDMTLMGSDYMDTTWKEEKERDLEKRYAEQ